MAVLGFEGAEVRVERMGLKAQSAWVAVSIVMLTLAASGCRARRPDAVSAGRVDTPEGSAEKVAGAGMAIVSACSNEPYANANKGLIVSETGLHEDVFDLRDRKTYQSTPFGLNEALRLEDLLRKQAGTDNARYTSQQAACIEQFASHFQTLTDPLVQADAEQKQLDISAFDKASKEAEQESQQQTEQEQKAIAPANSNPR